MPEQTSHNHTTPVDTAHVDDDSNPWTKTSLRRALRHYNPATRREARLYSMECVERAEAVSRTLTEFIRDSGVTDLTAVRICAELAADLCDLAYGPMMDWWDDDEDLERKGWQRPIQEGR